MVSRKNLWNRLEEIKVSLELRVAAIRMYENVIAKFKNIEGWSKEINCNIGVKQGCPLSPTLFGIYIDKLEDCLEKEGCVGPTLTGIVINLLLYADDIILMARSPHDLENQLRILKDFCSNMGMTVNTDKTKVMIIKSNKIPYDTFIYDNNNLEEVTSYKYLGIDIHHKLNWNYSIEKRIIGGWKAYYGLENNCKSVDLWSWDKKKLLFETLVTPVILYGCEVWGCSISRESWRKIEKIQKNFITYNLKIKGNTPYPILLLETSLSPIESMAMTRYLMYKNKLNNMEDKRLPKIASKSSHNHHRLKQGWHKDARSWLNYWGIMEDTILQNKDTIKKIVKSKFKEKMWCDKELEEKRKLRYYKDVINPNLEDQNYLSVLPSVKKKISIAKIRTNSHELHSETGHWSIPKTPWDERVCHLCDTKKVEDEKHFLLDCPAYTHIRSHFQNICHTTNLPNLLTQQNYGDLGKLLLMFFEHINKILKNHK
jgi:hypothetical protein